MDAISNSTPDFYQIDTSRDRLLKVLLDHGTASEKPLLDTLVREQHNSLKVPLGTIIDADLQKQALFWTKLRMQLPKDVLNSIHVGARMYFYLELAQRTGLPFAVDPGRSKYLAGLLDHVGAALARDTPDKLLERFNELIVNPDRLEAWRKEGLRRAEVKIPPVAEYVVRSARQNKQGLLDALTEIRMSKGACDFREMCAQVRFLRDEGGTAALLAREKMLNELEALGMRWAENCGPVTDYRVRQVNIAEIAEIAFDAIPGLGAVGKLVKQ